MSISKCGFKKWKTRDVVHEHLTCRYFPQNYKIWYLHGEGPSVTESVDATSVHAVEDFIELQNQMEDMLNDTFGFVGHDVNEFNEDDGMQIHLNQTLSSMQQQSNKHVR